MDQYYSYFMAANSCFKELLLIAFFGHLHQCFRVGHPIMITLIIFTYEISAFDTSFQPWRGVFCTNLFDKLDKVWENPAYVLIIE